MTELLDEPQEPAAAVAPPDAGQPQPGIRATDRVLVLGPTESGKSTLINVISAEYRVQRLIVDTKDELTVPGAEPVHKLEAIDWSAPVIHYVNDSGDLREYNRLFKLLSQRRLGRQGPRAYGIVVVVHEANDLCGDNPAAAGQWVTSYARKMRAHGGGLLAGSQRPVNLPKAFRTEAAHVFAMERPFDPDDQAVVAKTIGVTEQRFVELQAQARALGQHAYIWVDRRAQHVVVRPPLPQQLRQRGIASVIDH